MGKNFKKLPYDPTKLTRELTPYYISATSDEISEMLSFINKKDLSELYEHIPKDLHAVDFKGADHLSYDDLIEHVEEVSKLNNIKPSFIGDGLKSYKVDPIVEHVSAIRGLTTAYTPYQPERSQGTLYTLWMYSSSLSSLTGFEAINASFYDRSTALHEALNTSQRLVRGSKIALVSEAIYPGDIEVLKTLVRETKLEIKFIPVDEKTGLTDMAKLKEVLEANKADVCSISFPQVNSFGLLENVHELTDLADEYGVKSIAVIDPMLLVKDGLIPPTEFGKNGASMIVGEAQHLAIGPNYGGPGLGLFGIRYNEKNKNDIRATAGRYVGRAKDSKGNDCLCMVLSTREQHIRREKATSNICSNQSFLATLVGASLYARGEEGLSNSLKLARKRAVSTFERLTSLKGVEAAFETPFFNEFTLKLDTDVKALIKKASTNDLHIGVNVSDRVKNQDNLLEIYFNDVQTDDEIEKLISFFENEFGTGENKKKALEIPANLIRNKSSELKTINRSELETFYTKLGELNVSPDDNIYPLGSCTMKYNPYINDYAATLKGFTDIHPQAPEEDAQGSLKLLYKIQEYFKNITGLPGVTTQPVAGAQGELVGIKMFQAYHEAKGEKRDIILIPRSAHGTNPATATMAGFETKRMGDEVYGIVTIEANEHGEIDFDQFKACVEKYGKRISGTMITNPNTSGLFETKFKEIADLLHSVDALVYMDGANMNAIAGWVDLDRMGVDAVHNNLHKTWTIPHGGGGPGDAIVAVSEKLIDYLPGIQVEKDNGVYKTVRPKKSIGSIHRHFGNFAHKVRCYTYLKALGSEGIQQMSGVSVLAAKYLYNKIKHLYPTLPVGSDNVPKMHEFIITITDEDFKRIADSGTPKAQAVAKIGKLFLDFGLHAPTVAFPEVYGLMIEPTESFTKKELDSFIGVLESIHKLITETPEVLQTTPHFTPVSKVDEVRANKNLCFFEKIESLPRLPQNLVNPKELEQMAFSDLCQKIYKAHKDAL